MLQLRTFLLLISVLAVSFSASAQENPEFLVEDNTSDSARLSLANKTSATRPVASEFDLVGNSAIAEEAAPECCIKSTHGEDHAKCDCICCRDDLFGDWLGKRATLAEHGIVYDAQLTQFHQGVASGGNRRDFDYGGKLDQFVIFDFEKLGLCHHLTAVMHAETRFGESAVKDAVLLAPVNTNMLWPKLDENDTAITGLQFELALTDEWAFTFGKINTLDLFYAFFPQTGRGVDGLMNISNLAPLTIARSIPLVFLGAGALKKRGQQLEGGFLVYDSNNTPTTSGFDVLFDNGANLAGFWRIFTECGGLPGSHLFLGTYATGDFTSLDPTGWVIIPPGAIVPAKQSGTWSFSYFLEQKLWVDPCNEKRNIAIYSPWGWADPDTSPFEWAGSIAIQAQGLLCCRENDTMGVGYFYSGLSNQFKNLLQPVTPVDDLQGVELYYNAEITPWFHLTADLQIVEPAVQTNDTAVVFALRAKINL